MVYEVNAISEINTAQPELIEKTAYIRGFEQGRTQGMIDSQGGEEMNKQRKVLITVTYNEMGIIIDTKAEEVAQPNLQPTCNQLATDTISRQATIDELDKHCDNVCQYSKKQRSVMCGACPLGTAFDVIEELPSAQPEQRWIPCSERLPEDGQEVLIQNCNGYMTTITYSAMGLRGHIAAWMPLPEPYSPT